MHSIQTAKTFHLMFVLTCWNDSQERSIKSLRPAERLIKNNDNHKHSLRLVVTSIRVEARFFLRVDVVSHFHSGTKSNDLQLFSVKTNLASKSRRNLFLLTPKRNLSAFFLAIL